MTDMVQYGLDFEVTTKNDFTLSELRGLLDSNSEVLIRPAYKRNENPGRQEDGSYVMTFDYNNPIGYNAYTMENSFFYDGGTVEGIGTFEVVNEWNNGDQNDMGSILKHVESGRLFRKEGTYSSWDSSYWDGDLTEVKEVEVISVAYANIKTGKRYADPLVVRRER